MNDFFFIFISRRLIVTLVRERFEYWTVILIGSQNLDNVLIFFFLLAGFTKFTNIHESHDCWGRGRAFQLLTTTSACLTDTYTMH